jgi:hypothetical protein
VKRRVFELCCVLVSALVVQPAAAKELDQFTDRLQVLAYYAGGHRSIPGAPSPVQVAAVLDARMNELLSDLRVKLQRDPPRTAAERVARIRAVFQHRYLPELITPYEEWVKHVARVPLYKVRDKGIYGHAVDYDDMRMTWYIELSPILQVAGVLIGIDKLGHYLAQGFQYYERYQALSELPEPERAERLREYGHSQELGQLGIATGGVYSLADLAANWAGMMFFLALFDDVKLEGVEHARYFKPDASGIYQRVRDFHWSEWITSDWDELQNPALASERALFDKVSVNFWRAAGAPGAQAPSICASYLADPATFIGPVAPRTTSRYALPLQARAVAPYAIDVRAICAQPVVEPTH